MNDFQSFEVQTYGAANQVLIAREDGGGCTGHILSQGTIGGNWAEMKTNQAGRGSSGELEEFVPCYLTDRTARSILSNPTKLS